MTAKRHRRERGDVAIEILVLGLALIAMVAFAAAVVSHSRNVSALHDTARHAGYAALAETVPTGSVAEATGLAGLRSTVESRLGQAWANQLQWLASESHNPEIATRCASTATVGSVTLTEAGLAGGLSNSRAVLLGFSYSCSIPAPLGLDAVVGNMVIAGQWTEVAPWMLTG